MQYYDEVQEVNERRKRRILAYYEYIDARTREQMAEVVHKLTEQRQSQGLSQQNIAEATGMEINIEVVPIAKSAAEED